MGVCIVRISSIFSGNKAHAICVNFHIFFLSLVLFGVRNRTGMNGIKVA